MKILIECGVRVPLPVKLYGGTQRVLWDLASELSRLGHKITLLAAAGTVCPFAERVIVRDPSLQLKEQIPDDVDVCHFNNFVVEKLDVPKPYVITMHGNVAPGRPMDKNTIFVSKNHASRYGADAFVYNGLDWSNSPKYQQNATRDYFHFIGKGTFKVKNLPGTIKLFQRYADKRCGERFVVMGGTRLQIKHGFRYTFDRRIDFLGMVDDGQK